ncbi:hypothetical protein [Streptomyces sp. NPDC002588]|uniref:hypothetical protein n=1 Tax=Streptomyces sp. NPDC002588 TaxID=3154419 RepID=UPI00332EA648
MTTSERLSPHEQLHKTTAEDTGAQAETAGPAFSGPADRLPVWAGGSRPQADGTADGQEGIPRWAADPVRPVAAALPEGRGAAPAKRQGPSARRRGPRMFRLWVDREMSPPELLREFVRQYYQATDEQQVDRWLPLWHWRNPRGRSATAADVGRFMTLPVTDVTQTAMDRLSAAEQAEINAEADARLQRENALTPGTRLGTGPEDAVLRGRWLGARADVLHEHNLRRDIAALPDAVKRILFAGGRPLAPADYENVLRLGRKLSDLTGAQRADYLGKVGSTTTSWAELDASVERYLLAERIRESETERTEEAAGTIFGCEDLYLLRARRNELRRSAQPGDDVVPSAESLSELASAEAQFDAALARHGFKNERAFTEAMETYRIRFRAEAASVGLDILAHYEHLLHEERLKLQDIGYVRTMVAGIADTTARRDYAVAAEKETLAGLTHAGHDPESRSERFQAGAAVTRYRAQAGSARASAEKAVVTGSGGDPLVDPDVLGRGTDREKLAGLDAPGAQGYLLGVVQDRLRDAATVRSEFEHDPERVFSQPDLVEATKKSQEVDDDTIYGWIIRDHIADERSAHLFSSLVVGLIALVLAALVPGGGWLAAAALLTNTALSTYQAVEAINEHHRQAAEYRLSFLREEPSLVWVGIAVAAAALDLGTTTAQLLKSSAKGLTSLEGPLRQFAAAADAESAAARFEALSAKIDAVDGLLPEVKEAVRAHAAAMLGLHRVAGRASVVMGPTALFEGLYYAVKAGTRKLTQLRKNARMLAIMGDVTGMSRAESEALEVAFERVKEIVNLGGRREMDEATVLRYVDELAAERSAGDDVYRELLAEMGAWRRPTQEQVRAETELAAASEQLASFRHRRAELAASLRSGLKTPSGAPDLERIKAIREEIGEFDNAPLTGSKAGSEGEIRLAERRLESAMLAAEAARTDPTTRMRAVFNASRERVGVRSAASVDQVGPLRTGAQGLAVDHIVSIRRMSRMKGFDKLKAIERDALAVRRDNLVLMDASANSSKGERSWAAWGQSSTYYGADVIERWTGEDARLTKAIQDWILDTVRGR